MLVLVFGIPGVGKTTVLEEVQKIKSDIVIKKFGSIGFEIAQQKGWVKDRDEIRKLDLEKQKELQILAIGQLKLLKSQNSHLIVDTHAAVKTPNGYWPGMNENYLREIQPDGYVLIECSPETILRHRLADTSRDRDDDNLELIEQHQMIDRAFAATYATITSGNILIVKNHEGDPKFAAEKIAAVF